MHPLPIIAIDGAHKCFASGRGQHCHAVRNASLQVYPGDVFGLIGKSGAGKSTLLRLVNLLERPDSGTVTVAGRELTGLNKADLRAARQQIGMIFQAFNLLQNATVFDNVAFPLKIHHTPAAQVRLRVRECLELVGMADKAHSYPARLSGGQKQRVAIARALASRPAVLLCDEPTSALDPDTTRALLDTLRDINRRLGVTIVIVSHALEVIHAICNRVAVIEDGAVAEQFTLGQSHPRRTALGRELMQFADLAQAARAPVRREAIHA